MNVLYLESNEKKNSGKCLNMVEARFAEVKQKMNSLKIKLQKCYNVKGDLNNMEQVEMEYKEIDIWKVNEINFLNEEVEEFTSMWSKNLVNLRSPSYWKEKPLNIVYEA